MDIDIDVPLVAPAVDLCGTDDSDLELVDEEHQEVGDYAALNLDDCIDALEDHAEADHEEDQLTAPLNSDQHAARANNLEPVRQKRRQHTILFKLKVIQRITVQQESKRHVCMTEALDKNMVDSWLAKKEELMQVAKDAIHLGRRLHGGCHAKAGGFSTKYTLSDQQVLD